MRRSIVLFFIIGTFVFIGFNIGVFYSEQNFSVHTVSEEKIKNNQKEQKYEEIFLEAKNIIHKYYQSFPEVTEENLVRGMIRGYVDGLGDKHSQYFTPKEAKEFAQYVNGNFEGIGAYVDMGEQGVVVTGFVGDSPAKQSGLQVGDIIITANTTELSWMPIDKAISYIKGPKGSTVDLEVFRKWEDKILEISVVREKINIPLVETEILEEENIAYVQIYSFGEQTSKDFWSTLQDLVEKNISGIIIDLRNNGGGYLQSAVDMLSNIIPQWETLVEIRSRTDFMNEIYVSGNQKDFSIPLVILVNRYSASASEIMAGALQDHNKAILIGETTYGKGSVQQPFYLSDGSEVKLTVAHWYTPKGIRIEETGITPDILFDFDIELFKKEGVDSQLEWAKKILDVFKKEGIEKARNITQEELEWLLLLSSKYPYNFKK